LWYQRQKIKEGERMEKPAAREKYLVDVQRIIIENNQIKIFFRPEGPGMAERFTSVKLNDFFASVEIWNTFDEDLNVLFFRKFKIVATEASLIKAPEAVEIPK
jgi:hypothetical protein